MTFAQNSSEQLADPSKVMKWCIAAMTQKGVKLYKITWKCVWKVLFNKEYSLTLLLILAKPG
jgi:hypothetical protein